MGEWHRTEKQERKKVQQLTESWLDICRIYCHAMSPSPGSSRNEREYFTHSSKPQEEKRIKYDSES